MILLESKYDYSVIYLPCLPERAGLFADPCSVLLAVLFWFRAGAELFTEDAGSFSGRLRKYKYMPMTSTMIKISTQPNAPEPEEPDCSGWSSSSRPWC